jgi:hypothetical protein
MMRLTSPPSGNGHLDDMPEVTFKGGGTPAAFVASQRREAHACVQAVLSGGEAAS